MCPELTNLRVCKHKQCYVKQTGAPTTEELFCGTLFNKKFGGGGFIWLSMHSFQIKSIFLQNRYTSLQPDIFSKKETHSSMIYTDHETKIISPPEAPPSFLLQVTVTPPLG